MGWQLVLGGENLAQIFYHFVGCGLRAVGYWLWAIGRELLVVSYWFVG
jgi:hypothetical protein